MRNVLSILITFIALQFFYACVKDDSATDMITLTGVDIEGIADTITVSADEMLNINPLLETEAPSGTAYEYMWYAFTTNMQFRADTLSKEKNLSATIKLLPGTYTLVYRIKDQHTGIFYKRTATLIVVNDYTPGIMILGEVNGKAVLQFLNTANGKYITDVYEKSNNGEVLGSNPVSVSYYAKAYQMPAEVLVLCKDQQGGVFSDPVTFEKIRSLRSSFYAPLEEGDVINVSRYVERYSNLQDYVIIDGRPSNRGANAGDLLFKPAMLGDYYVSPVVFNENASRFTFFDTQGRRFMAHNNTTGSLSIFKSDPTHNIIDPNNVGLDILYAGGVTPTEFFGLFKTPGQSEYYILRMNINALGLTFTAKEKYIMTAPDISQAIAFASSASLSNYLFYASGSKCYVYNVVSRSGGLLFDMGSGYSINFLKMTGSELKVGFKNSGLADKNAGFATYNITTQGGIQAAETRRREGLFDKLIDLTDKQ